MPDKPSNARRIENAKSYPLGMNTGDVDKALANFAEDATYWGIQRVDGKIRRKLYGSKAELHTYISDWLRIASSGITYQIRDAKEWGDCVLLEWSDVASGEGRRYENEGILVFEFNDRDQIVHARAYQDFGPLNEWGFLAR